MPLTRTQKEDAVLQLQEEFTDLQNMVVLDYRGLKVGEVDELRRRMRESNSTYKVVKNTLALLAMQGTDVSTLSEHFDGPTAIAHNPESLIDLAKVIEEFGADHEALEVRAGMLDGKLLGPAELAEIAKLPGLNELRAQLIGLLVAPVTQLLGLMEAVPREMAVVVSEYAKKREDAGETAPAAETADETPAPAEEAEAAPGEAGEPAAEDAPAPAAQEPGDAPAEDGEKS
jgi:large subunit ribosomal protein L10